jgi:hypothetical protein
LFLLDEIQYVRCLQNYIMYIQLTHEFLITYRNSYIEVPNPVIKIVKFFQDAVYLPPQLDIFTPVGTDCIPYRPHRSNSSAEC